MAETWFVPGEIVYQVLPTKVGWISFSAEVSVEGTVLRLTEIDYKPLHTKTLLLGVRENLQLRELIVAQARAEGYTRVVFDGVRIVAGRSNREVHYERNV